MLQVTGLTDGFSFCRTGYLPTEPQAARVTIIRKGEPTLSAQSASEVGGAGTNASRGVRTSSSKVAAAIGRTPIGGRVLQNSNLAAILK